MGLVVAYASGLVFALGLGIGGMTQPSKVVAFLDVFGKWDPSLAFVMGGAILAHLPFERLSAAWANPVFEKEFHRPSPRSVDARLLVGASLFGLGWGIGGFCPGPAITAIASADPRALLFVGSMIAGMLLYASFERLAAIPTGDCTDC